MSVQSVERAFALLRALAVGPLGVTELADRVDLPKSTVARLLNALEREGAVTQLEAGGDYRLGDGLLDIAGATQPGRNLIATVRPHLLELTAEIGEAAGLSVSSGRDVYYLDQTVTETDVMVRDWTGETLPLHSVSAGLAIMAAWPDAELDAYLAEPLEAPTSATLVDPNAVRERLASVRSIGYAWVYEEGVAGINSIAAAVMRSDGAVEAAIHVHGPAFRFPDPDTSHDLGLRMIEAAQSVAQQLGT